MRRGGGGEDVGQRGGRTGSTGGAPSQRKLTLSPRCLTRTVVSCTPMLFSRAAAELPFWKSFVAAMASDISSAPAPIQ